MEFGPRALGSRSVLGDESPYMLMVGPVRDDKRRPLQVELVPAQGLERLKQ